VAGRVVRNLSSAGGTADWTGRGWTGGKLTRVGYRRREWAANGVVGGDFWEEVGEFAADQVVEPVAHEGPEEVAAGVAAVDFAAEVGVGMEDDVGAVGELANPMAGGVDGRGRG
jgi:hypothetical protein